MFFGRRRDLANQHKTWQAVRLRKGHRMGQIQLPQKPTGSTPCTSDRQKLVESMALQGKTLVPAAQDRNALVQAIILGMYPELVCVAGELPDLPRAKKVVQDLEAEMHETILQAFEAQLRADSTWDAYIKAAAKHYNIGIICYSANNGTASYNCSPTNRATVEVATYIRPASVSPPLDATQYFEGVWRDAPLRTHKCAGDAGFDEALTHVIDAAAAALHELNYAVNEDHLDVLRKAAVAVFYEDSLPSSLLFCDGQEAVRMQDIIQRMDVVAPRYLRPVSTAPPPRIVGSPPLCRQENAATSSSPAAGSPGGASSGTTVVPAGCDRFRRVLEEYISRMTTTKPGCKPSAKATADREWQLRAYRVLTREVDSIVQRTDRPAHWELRIRGSKLILRSMKQTRHFVDGRA